MIQFRELYVANLDGSGLLKLSGAIGPDLEVDHFLESPDGSIVAARVVRNRDDTDDERGQIWLFDPTGVAQAENVPLAGNIASDALNFSPDSRFLSWFAAPGVERAVFPVLLDLSAATRTPLYFSAVVASRMQFTPDSRSFLYAPYNYEDSRFVGLVSVDVETLVETLSLPPTEGFDHPFKLAPMAAGHSVHPTPSSTTMSCTPSG